MDNTKILLVDMDAIVADLATEWYSRWNKARYDEWLYGGQKGPEPIKASVDTATSWDIGKVVGDTRIYGVLKQPGLYLSLKPMPGSQDALKSLFDRKLKNGKPAYDILFLTASITKPSILAEKAEWAQAHFPFITPKQMIMAYRKELVRGDFFLDDSPKNLAKFKAAWPNATTMTIDYPYNQNAQVGFRAGDYKDPKGAWEKIERYLQALATFPEGYQNLD